MWDFLNRWLSGMDREEDIENFLKQHPNIDIRIIIAKVTMFNDVVQSRVNVFNNNAEQILELEKLERYFLVIDADLKKELGTVLFWTDFLHSYSFSSIFPLAQHVKILSDDMIKVSMEYYTRVYRGRRRYFSYDLIFKRFDDDWAIVETNIVSQLYWREFKWILSVGLIIILAIVGSVADKNEKTRSHKLSTQTSYRKS